MFLVEQPERVQLKTSAEEYLKTWGQDYRNAVYLKVYGHVESPALSVAAASVAVWWLAAAVHIAPACQK